MGKRKGKAMHYASPIGRGEVTAHLAEGCIRFFPGLEECADVRRKVMREGDWGVDGRGGHTSDTPGGSDAGI